MTAVVKKSAYRWAAGVNYAYEDRVLVGETVYKCADKAKVELCASTDPTKDLSSRNETTGVITTGAAVKGKIW